MTPAPRGPCAHPTSESQVSPHQLLDACGHGGTGGLRAPSASKPSQTPALDRAWIQPARTNSQQACASHPCAGTAHHPHSHGHLQSPRGRDLPCSCRAWSRLPRGAALLGGEIPRSWRLHPQHCPSHPINQISPRAHGQARAVAARSRGRAGRGAGRRCPCFWSDATPLRAAGHHKDWMN